LPNCNAALHRRCMLIYLREEAGVRGIDESGGNRVSLA
jgi:hypothetical protein